MKIVNLGSLNLDHVYQVDRFLLPGETKASKSLTDNAGGKGLNQSIAAVRTGAEVYHAGYFGANSDMLRKVLVDSGVHTEWMEDHLDIPCGHTVIQVDDAGQNCILLF
ncbi:MAG: PfkB family carbohydrate kinase, partial [Eubacteriales bacterium]|nr:PfkB family carbohydrate kinase [Eubacteriales bacterium]